MYDVFISYPRTERVRAEVIRRKLEGLGLTVFFDIDGIDGGTVFPDVITRALDDSKAVLACCSPLYFTRPWCLIEAREGHAREVLVPVTLTAFDRAHPPADLRHLNYLNLVAWDGTEGHEDWERAVRRVGRLVGRDLKATSVNIKDSLAVKPVSGPWAPFDVDQLHPAVRAAALQARNAEREAHVVAAEARRAAERADDAARRARAKAQGTAMQEISAELRYEGEVDGSQRHGFGVLAVVTGDAEGDAYRGHWTANVQSGVGVNNFAENVSNKTKSLSYEGQYVADSRSGLGVFQWQSGQVYAGGYRDDKRFGPGVFRFGDGNRYEGEHADGKRGGLGVSWNADGSVAESGRWKDGILEASLAR